MASACASATGVQRSAESSSASLFELAVRALADSAPVSGLLVDPRPIREGAALGAMFDDGMYTSDADGEVEDRAIVLRALGFTRVDVRTLPSCAGTQVLDSTGHAHDGCPRTSVAILLVGSTRAAEQGARDTIVMPGLRISRAPFGSEVREFELTFARQGGRWHFIRRLTTTIVE